MAEYTPGPWQARMLFADGAIIRAAAWEVSTPAYDVVAHATHCAPIRKEADAHLIAAAPDLYEALRYIVDWKAEGWDAEKARDMARAAVAKATATAAPAAQQEGE